MREGDFEIIHGFATTKGKVRAKNEDSYGMVENEAYFVADGAGGLPAGEIASSFISKFFPYYFGENKDLELKKRFEKSIKQTHNEIVKYSITHPWVLGLCSTVAMVGFDKNQVIVGNVGDSRVYSVKDSEIKQLSLDQAIGNMLTHAVGVRIGKPPSLILPQELNTLFLLCTDGLNKMLSDEEILSIVLSKKISSNKDCEEVTNNLAEEANKHGGIDNTTVGIVKIS